MLLAIRLTLLVVFAAVATLSALSVGTAQAAACQWNGPDRGEFGGSTVHVRARKGVSCSSAKRVLSRCEHQGRKPRGWRLSISSAGRVVARSGSRSFTGVIAGGTPVCLQAASRLGSASAAASTRWVLPYPFATNASTPSGNLTIIGPVSSIKALGPMGSYAQFESLLWSNWGAKATVGRGKARYCDDGCNAYRSATIRLSLRKRLCKAPATDFYLRYKFAGKSLTVLSTGATLGSGQLQFCP